MHEPSLKHEVSRPEVQPLDETILGFHIDTPAFDLRVPTLANGRLLRIDNFAPGRLNALSNFPENVEDFISQKEQTVPVSAESELFSAQMIDDFKVRVERAVGDIDFQVGIAYCDVVHANGQVFYSQPIHSFSSFNFRGMRVCGPLIGSVANSILRHGSDLSPIYKQKLTVSLLETLQQAGDYDALAIAYKPKPPRGLNALDPGGITQSNTFKLFVGPLNYTSWQFIEESANRDLLYFYHGPAQYLEDAEFMRILMSIREVRQAQLDWLEAGADFESVEYRRSGIRAEYVQTVFGQQR